MTRRLILSVVLVAYLLFLFDIAWLRFPATNPKPNWIPFHSMIADWRNGGWGFVVNFLGNIVAFLPMGLVPPLICSRRVTIWQIASLAWRSVSRSSRANSFPVGAYPTSTT